MNNLSPEAALLINHVFKSLCGAKPSWRGGFKTNDDVNAYKEALALTFMENGITTQDEVHKGLAEARRNDNPFMPSTGEFLKWCQPDKTTSRPEHKLLICENKEPATEEEREQAHKILKDLRDSL